MKKIYYLIAMAFVALTFTSCEDVPAPYGQPINPNATVSVDPAGTGTANDPFNIAAAIAKCKEIGDAVSSEKYYVKGYAATQGVADATYGNASFYMTDSKDGKGKRFYAYQVLGSDGQKMDVGYTINVGDEVVVYGPMYNYNGSTPETASKGAAYIVTVNGEKTNGGGGGDTPTPSSGNMTKAVSGTTVTFTSSSVTGTDEVTVDFNAQGWADKAAATTITLDNGTKIEFAGGENTSNAPTFYSATKGVRVYAKNTITVKGSKAIAKIALNCDSYNGTDYVGNDMSYANADGNNVTICNDNTEAKGGVQMRVQTMVITFQGEGTGGGGGETGSAVLDIDFTKSQGDWVIKNVTGPAEGLSFIWSQTSQYGMKATAYISSSKTNTESDSWLISPAFNTTSAATLTFDQAFRYGAGDHSDLHVMVSSAYSGGDITASQWTEVTLDQWPAGTDWSFATSTASIPAGTKYVAFRYTSTSSAAATWEIKTVNIK